MFNFIKIKDNTWLNIDCITAIEYYPDGDGIVDYLDAFYLIITSANNEFYYYDNKEEAMGIIEKLRQHGVFLE